MGTSFVSEGFTDAEWDAARPWGEYLDGVREKRDVWLANWRRASVDEESRARLARLPAARRVLVLTEDWCGDAARSVPVLARAFEASDAVEHRYLESDDHPAAIERFLTHGGRAIPMAIVQDEGRRLVGAWGPRPAPLQALLRARRREIGPPAPDGLAAWYAPLMAWYGRDAGLTTVQEVLVLLERGGPAR